MGKKILKWVLWIIVCIVGLLLLVSFLVYVPSIQQFIKDKASSIVSNSTGMQLSIDRLRLRFPLNLTIDNTILLTPESDTLLRAGQISADVALWPLLAGNIQVRELALVDAVVNYTDTVSAMKLTARLDDFVVESVHLGLKKNRIKIGNVKLSEADADLWLGESTVMDTVDLDTASAAWHILLDRLDVSDLSFNMHTSPEVTELEVSLPQGEIRSVELNLWTQEVSVRSILLENGNYAYFSDTMTVSAVPEVEVSDSTNPDSASWDIHLDRLILSGNGFRYGVLNGVPKPGFDLNNLQLEQINLEISDVYYRTEALGAVIEKLAFTERSGLSVTEGKGIFAMDSASLRLNEFELRTPDSFILAEAEAAAGLLKQDAEAPLAATLQAEISPQDLYYFYTPEAALRRTLSGQMFRIDGYLEGSLSRLDIHTFSVALPGHIDFNAKGDAENILDTDHLAGHIALRGDFSNLDVFRPLLPDSMRGRIGFPRRMTLGGTVSVGGGTYTPDLRLTADSGYLTIKGSVNPDREKYNAEVQLKDFPLHAFLPKDSLGLLSLDLSAEGQGFDPRQEGAATDVKFALDHLDYNAYTYHGITLNANLADHQLQGNLASMNEGAKFDFNISGELTPEQYIARLTGKLDTLDLQRLGFMAEPFNASLFLDAGVSLRPDTTYRADILIDSIRWSHDYRTEYIDKTTLTASADPRGITAAVRSGDFVLDLNSPVSVDSLINGFSRTAGILMSQIDSMSFDMEPIQGAIPSFALQATAKRKNILHALLAAQGMDFGEINARVTTMNNEPLRVGVVINSLETSGLTLDTLNIGLWRNNDRLNYGLRLANRPGNIEQLALIALSGYAVGNTAQVNFYQRNRADSVGFRFGVNAQLLDSAVRVQMTSENPILAYVPWAVNSDNYLLYRFNQTFDANLRLDDPARQKHIYIRSAPLAPSLEDGAVWLDMKGIDIASMLELLPAPPAVGGILNTDIGLGFDRGQMVAGGKLGVNGLTYDKQRVGDVGAELDFQSDSLNRFMLDAKLTVDNRQVLKADGTYLTGDGSLSFRGTITSLPMQVANAFLPPDAVQLQGSLNGWLSVSGSTGNPVMNGEINFAEGKVGVPMIGTTYGLASTPIRISNSVLDLNRFSLLSPGSQPFVLDGTLDFGDLSRMMADLSVRTRNFDVINATRQGGSAIYGKALTDIDLTAKGRVDALTVRGRIALLRGTDVTYTLQEDEMSVESQKQDIVTFVDFNDPATFLPADTLNRLEIFGMDLLVSIDIEENINATVNISSDGNNRAEVAGSGSLTYTMNTQGDSRFMGRFDIASGRILYNPPVISQKDFTINPDSYVNWTGEMLNPTFDITAVEQVRAKVEGREDGSSYVIFDISIVIRNSLEDIAVLFDLAAPNDATIQLELTSLTPEQRSQQAMALLLYNTYSGPGTTASVDMNNPLNAFIEKELNQWARNNLQGVDLSFGIDQYDTAEGSHTDYSYQVSKNLFNDRVKVTIGGSINSDQNANDNLQHNFVDDVSAEYRLTERDNMFLKAYRYNTQESMLESEVVETGGGFLMRKKMNRLRDLFKLAPKEQMRELRELRREVRKEKKRAEAEKLDEPQQEADVADESEVVLSDNEE